MQKYSRMKFKLWLKMTQNNKGYMAVTKPLTIENAAKRWEDVSVSVGEDGGSVDLIALTNSRNVVMPRYWLTDVEKRLSKVS